MVGIGTGTNFQTGTRGEGHVRGSMDTHCHSYFSDTIYTLFRTYVSFWIHILLLEVEEDFKNALFYFNL